MQRFRQAGGAVIAGNRMQQMAQASKDQNLVEWHKESQALLNDYLARYDGELLNLDEIKAAVALEKAFSRHIEKHRLDNRGWLEKLSSNLPSLPGVPSVSLPSLKGSRLDPMTQDEIYDELVTLCDLVQENTDNLRALKANGSLKTADEVANFDAETAKEALSQQYTEAHGTAFKQMARNTGNSALWAIKGTASGLAYGAKATVNGLVYGTQATVGGVANGVSAVGQTAASWMRTTPSDEDSSSSNNLDNNVAPEVLPPAAPLRRDSSDSETPNPNRKSNEDYARELADLHGDARAKKRKQLKKNGRWVGVKAAMALLANTNSDSEQSQGSENEVEQLQEPVVSPAAEHTPTPDNVDANQPVGTEPQAANTVVEPTPANPLQAVLDNIPAENVDPNIETAKNSRNAIDALHGKLKTRIAGEEARLRQEEREKEHEQDAPKSAIRRAAGAVYTAGEYTLWGGKQLVTTHTGRLATATLAGTYAYGGVDALYGLAGAVGDLGMKTASGASSYLLSSGIGVAGYAANKASTVFCSRVSGQEFCNSAANVYGDYLQPVLGGAWNLGSEYGSHVSNTYLQPAVSHFCTKLTDGSLCKQVTDGAEYLATQYTESSPEAQTAMVAGAAVVGTLATAGLIKHMFFKAPTLQAAAQQQPATVNTVAP